MEHLNIDTLSEWIALSRHQFVLTGFLIVIGLLWANTRSEGSIPDEIPWAGRQSKIFSKARASFESLWKGRTFIEEGYHKYSTVGKAFLLPSWVSSASEAVLPPSLTRWVSIQPDDVLNMIEPQYEMVQMDYTFPYHQTINDGLHFDVLKRDLNRQLRSLTTGIMEELRSTLQERWGVNTEEWKEFVILKEFTDITARFSSRIMVGLPLCRNEEYLRNIVKHVRAVGFCGYPLRFVPKFLKPVLGPLIALPSHYYHRKCVKILVPMIRQRMADMEKTPEPGTNRQDLNDFTTWLIRASKSRPNPRDRSPEIIAARILLINFAAMLTTSISMSNLFLDVFGSPRVSEFVGAMREEVDRLEEKNGGIWTKEVLSRTIRLDSAFRESLRFSSPQGTGLLRKVKASKGIMLDEGYRLPRGSIVSVPSYSIHHDEKIYPRAYEYDPFRFSRPLETIEEPKQTSGNEGTTEIIASSTPNGSGRKLESLVTTSETFLTFGHGPHACPGRFFAADAMKLFLAQVLLHYDVEPLSTRYPNLWMFNISFPSMQQTIRVKRKSD